MLGPISGLRRWMRFSVVNLLVLTIGIALGFLPLKLWELREAPQPQFVVHLRVVEVDRASLPALSAEATKSSHSPIPLQKENSAVDARLEALCQAGQARILAEPTLIATNGRRTWFKSGGEFPFPKAENGGTTIGFRDFGIRADVMPTLLRNGRIRLAISTCVSELDATHAVTVADVTFPGLKSRTMETDVELNEHQAAVLRGGPVQSGPDTNEREIVIVASVERRGR
jgi:Flp pilus assembly secretin CpaC